MKNYFDRLIALLLVLSFSIQLVSTDTLYAQENTNETVEQISTMSESEIEDIDKKCILVNDDQRMYN